MGLVAALLIAVMCGFAAEPARTSRVRAGAAAVASPISFRAAALYPMDGRSHVRVRASLDGVNWSPWIETVRENEGGAFAWFEAPQQWIEVDTPAEVLFIDPGVSSFKPEPRRFAADSPPMVLREQWGCSAEACAFRGGSPAYAPVTHLVVHHTAGANSASDWAAVVRSIWTFHVEGNRWSDIGYNYLIDPNGVLYEGRQGGPGVIGAHFSGVNTGTMGVSLLGTYSNVPPADAAVSMLAQMLAWHAQRWQLDLGGASLHAASQLRLNVVSGHRDAGLSPRASGGTECPGNALYVLLPRLRGEVRAPSCPEGVPCIGAVVTSGARERTPVVAGSWISIYGSELSRATATDGELPASLGGVSVTINGTRQARLLFVSPGQINAQLPAGVPIGSARMVVTRDGTASSETLFWVTEAAPVIFVSQNHDDAGVNSAAVPVGAGRPLIVYLTGAGAGSLPWSATVGGRSAAPLFLGPVPGFVGLFQANIVVPELPSGAHELRVVIAGARSEPALVHVR